jgi:methyltransferase (TIGR00027 family)
MSLIKHDSTFILHRPSQPSRTADSAAAGRAAHLLYETPLIFEDPYAINLTSPLWRFVCKNKILAWMIFNRSVGIMRPIGAHILARSRYAEDQLELAIDKGLTQYVIIGAGMDSFTLRRTDLMDRLKVFELDLPASQELKKNRIQRLNKNLPDKVEYIPSDSEEETVMEALSRSSFSFDRPAFFSWLGTTYYLTRRAVVQSLKAIVKHTTIGSEIVFDYGIPPHLHRGMDRLAWKTIKQASLRCGEPILTSFLPEHMADILKNMGYYLREQLSPEDQRLRYFHFSTKSTMPIASYFIHAQSQGGT